MPAEVAPWPSGFLEEQAMPDSQVEEPQAHIERSSRDVDTRFAGHRRRELAATQRVTEPCVQRPPRTEPGGLRNGPADLVTPPDDVGRQLVARGVPRKP